jgi:hypothetical protein
MVRAFAVSEAVKRLDPETIRIAQQIRHAKRPIVGLLPASPTVVCWPLALALGLSLARLGNGRVALVDVDLAWPELEPTIEQDDEAPRWEDLFVGTMSLAPSVELVRPMHKAPEGGRVPLLEVTLQRLSQQSPAYTEIVVDLGGFAGRPGEFLAALDLVRGVFVVARAGQTRDLDLTALLESLPDAQNLGVVLVT